MAFYGSTAAHRKLTTYGKLSRRPTSKLSSATEIEFAQDVGASILDSKVTARHRQVDAKNASPSLLQGRSESEAPTEKLHRQALASTAKPKDQNRSASGRSDPAKDDPLYDVSLSDSGRSRAVNVACKRRKVMPGTVTAEKDSQVYDDDSLQRYIAAEAMRDEGQTLPSSTRILNVHDSKSWCGAVKTKVKARDCPNKGMSETSRATPSHEESTLDRKQTGDRSKASDKTKGRLVAQEQSKGIFGANVMPRKKQKTSTNTANTSARQITPDSLFDEPSSQRVSNAQRNSYTSRLFVDQPKTPPMPNTAAGGATTPRQRELWNRLFVDNEQTGSPSSLDLPSLLLDDKQSKSSHEETKQPGTSWEPLSQSVALKARPTKIVDTLHQSNKDQDQCWDSSVELYGSTSSEIKSESAHSDFSAPGGALTVQTSLSGDSQCVPSQSQDRLSFSSQARSSLYGGGHRVTYARQRSYLTDTDLKEAGMIDSPFPPDSYSRRGHGRRGPRDQLPILQSLQSPEEFGDHVDPPGGTMRSIHELREAGGNVRLVSELEAILDDLGDRQPGSASISRSRLIDLVVKFEDPLNCRLFVDQGMESRLILDIGSSKDLIFNSLLVAALLQLMTCSSSRLLLTQVGNVRVVRFLTDLLGSDQDILYHARLRENNVSKAVQADLKDIRSALLDSTAWKAGKPAVLSCQVLSLQCLEVLVRQTREAGSLSEVLSASAIERVVATSVPHSSTKAPRPSAVSVICLELAVSILESCTINNAAECQASLWAGETLERIVGLLPLLALWKGKECGTTRTLALRLYLNLTNNSPGICDEFSTSEVVSVLFGIVISHFEQLADTTLEVDRALLLDDLILSLGSLINLADLSNMARQLVMDLHHESQSYLDILLQLFMNKSKNAAEVRLIPSQRYE